MTGKPSNNDTEVKTEKTQKRGKNRGKGENKIKWIKLELNDENWIIKSRIRKGNG